MRGGVGAQAGHCPSGLLLICFLLSSAGISSWVNESSFSKASNYQLLVPPCPWGICSPLWMSGRGDDQYQMNPRFRDGCREALGKKGVPATASQRASCVSLQQSLIPLSLPEDQYESGFVFVPYREANSSSKSQNLFRDIQLGSGELNLFIYFQSALHHHALPTLSLIRLDRLVCRTRNLVQPVSTQM